jgi:hypothetical protein
MGHSKSAPLSIRDLARQATAILYHNMDAQPQVTEVEWLQDGVNICFDDGRTALFSTALLYANLPVRKGLQTAQ